MNKRVYGSITVEAALVMPLFIYGVVAFLYFLQILYIQECIQAGITEVAKEASRYGYVYQDLMNSNSKEKDTKGNDPNPEEKDNTLAKSIVDGSFLKIRLNNYLSKCGMSDSSILGGKTGIIMASSSFMKEGQTIDVIAVYHIKIPIAFIHINGFTMVQRVRTRAFVGLDNGDIGGEGQEKEGNKEEQIVYITQTGTVYHSERECTHLKLSIKTVAVAQLEVLRNQGGGKYTPCDYCALNDKLKENEIIYITDDGHHYHTTLGCSGLKRTIFAVPISEVNGRRPCKRCH